MSITECIYVRILWKMTSPEMEKTSAAGAICGRRLKTVIGDDQMFNIPLIAASDVISVLLIKAVNMEILFI